MGNIIRLFLEWFRLDASGKAKATIFYQLKIGKAIKTIPTIGTFCNKIK